MPQKKKRLTAETAPDSDLIEDILPLTPEVQIKDQHIQYDDTCKGCQTDLTRVGIDQLLNDIESIRKENIELKEKCEQSAIEIKELEERSEQFIREIKHLRVDASKDRD